MFKPEIWLSALALLIFIPMSVILGKNPNFDLWRFSLMFTGLSAWLSCTRNMICANRQTKIRGDVISGIKPEKRT